MTTSVIPGMFAATIGTPVAMLSNSFCGVVNWW
jgi:hypothetical protein